MAGEPRTISIDLGRCPGWTLQSGKADSTDFIRCLDDAEHERIAAAAAFCGQYVLNSPSRLLSSSHRILRDITERINSQSAQHLSFELFDEFQSGLIGWVLIWRLVLDQADHNVSGRFGKESDERSLLKQARNDAYDAHQGYRVVEAMRNLIQHRELPPFSINLSKQLHQQTGQVVSKFEVTFPVSWLLESSKCPAKIKNEFSNGPHGLLNLNDIVEDAMAGFKRVFVALTKINQPDLLESITLLRRILARRILVFRSSCDLSDHRRALCLVMVCNSKCSVLMIC